MPVFTLSPGFKGDGGKISEREAIISAIAEVCHNANRAYCMSLGDDSQVPWEDAPTWQRESAHEGVRMLVNNPNAEAGASHACWVAGKLQDGWRYGLIKDPELKRHPCIMPFHDLHPSQQVKDHIFRSIVHALGQSLMSGGK